MNLQESIFGQGRLRRALAVVGCLALLYFAAGATLHHHGGGADTACHICQALHMPALAAAAVGLLDAPEAVTRYSSPAKHVVWIDSFSLHRAGRAPPTS